jgi:transposase
MLSDDVWQWVEPCLPPVPHRRRVPGPRPIHDRAVLAGILFVLRSGLPWEELPAEMGAGSGMTCLRRLRHWQRDGTWDRIRRALTGVFPPGEVDWRRADPPRRRGPRRKPAGGDARAARRGSPAGRRPRGSLATAPAARSSRMAARR